MQYVYTGAHQAGISDIEREKIERAANWLTVDGEGCLTIVETGGGLRRIPVLAERQAILEDFQLQCGFASGDRLYSVIKRYFYWKKLRVDCLIIAREAVLNK